MRGIGNKDIHMDFGQEKENVRLEAFPFLKAVNKTLEQFCINAPAS